jgi:hypothetical protein
MRFIYNQCLFLFSIIKLFNFRNIDKLILIDFDFTLVKYDFTLSNKIDIRKAILNKTVIENCDYYKSSGFVPALFTARGLRSQKEVTTFLDKHSIKFNQYFFLGNTKNKFRFLKLIMKFTTLKIILIDDLSDYVETDNTFLAYEVDEALFSYNERFKYIHPFTYENS